VVGISAAFFSNFVIAQLFADAQEGVGFPSWRWMLGVEALPALAYLLGLGAVPESPRWLKLRGEGDKAFTILSATAGEAEARTALEHIVPAEPQGLRIMLRRLLDPALRPVLFVALGVAVLQQITGINAVFFYAPMIFEKAGAGVDSALLQAVLIGLVNLLFTLVALRTIDRLGRRPLLLLGLGGITLAMALLSFAFNQADYGLSADALATLEDPSLRAALAAVGEQRFPKEAAFREALAGVLSPEALAQSEKALLGLAIQIDAVTVLAAIMLFVASFALSLGPVMWVLFSELFPLPVRALAAATAGLVSSLVSFLVQLLFPWALAALGPAQTFGLFGVFALLGLFWVGRAVPETRGRPLEAMEGALFRSP
jgi:MFS family permease